MSILGQYEMLLVWLLYSHTELKVRIQHPSLKMININYNERIYERNYICLRWWKTSNDVIAVENAEIGNSPWRGEVLPQFYPEEGESMNILKLSPSIALKHLEHQAIVNYFSGTSI